MEDPIISIEDIVIAPDVRRTASAHGAVLLDIEQAICFSLNPVGLKIWELLKRRYSVDQIADALAHDFPVSRSQLLSDVAEFLQSLDVKRFIRRSGRTGGYSIMVDQDVPVGKTTSVTQSERALARFYSCVLSMIKGGHT